MKGVEVEVLHFAQFQKIHACQKSSKCFLRNRQQILLSKTYFLAELLYKDRLSCLLQQFLLSLPSCKRPTLQLEGTNCQRKLFRKRQQLTYTSVKNAALVSRQQTTVWFHTQRNLFLPDSHFADAAAAVCKRSIHAVHTLWLRCLTSEIIKR